MPSLGADMTEGTLLEWQVAPGAQVHRGDIVAVVDTDKAAIEVECFQDGVVEELLVPPGTKVAVGTALARIRDDADVGADADVAGKPAEPPPPLPPTKPDILRVDGPLVRRLATEQGVDLGSIHGTGPDGVVTREDVIAAESHVPPPAATPAATPVAPAAATRNGKGQSSPYARRRAAELGVDIAAVVGSGPSGVVTASDVEAQASRPSIPSGPNEAAQRNAAMRRAIGDLMARSKREVPHYYLSTTVDMSAAMEWLRRTNAGRPVTARLVPAALLLKACALAARRVPALNGWWTDGALQPSDHVQLGVAVALRPSGLVAPAILDADTLDVETLMARLQDLVTRARAGRLRGREMSEGTITVTNLGDNGAESVYGVIYPPQVALVGIGRITERPFARDGLVGARPSVTMTLAGDHRATDGHEGSRYLAACEALLQKPEEL